MDLRILNNDSREMKKSSPVLGAASFEHRPQRVRGLSPDFATDDVTLRIGSTKILSDGWRGYSDSDASRSQAPRGGFRAAGVR